MSPFKHLLLALCKAPTGGKLLVCSGYIWEEPGYRVSSDGLLSAIQEGLNGRGYVQLVAGKLGDNTKWPHWETMYREFIRALMKAGLQVEPFIAPERNWHAKVAIRFDSLGIPVAGIVGSSNLTGPAFRDRYDRWNYEADVLLWTPDADLDQHFMKALDEIPDPFDKWVLSGANGVQQPNESERLRVLESDVFRYDGELRRYNPFDEDHQ